MAFLQSFLTTLLEAVFIVAVAVGGIFLGKFLRQKKDAKDANETAEVTGGNEK